MASEVSAKIIPIQLENGGETNVSTSYSSVSGYNYDTFNTSAVGRNSVNLSQRSPLPSPSPNSSRPGSRQQKNNNEFDGYLSKILLNNSVLFFTLFWILR